jgi:hypothetical protein
MQQLEKHAMKQVERALSANPIVQEENNVDQMDVEEVAVIAGMLLLIQATIVLVVHAKCVPLIAISPEENVDLFQTDVETHVEAVLNFMDIQKIVVIINQEFALNQKKV